MRCLSRSEILAPRPPKVKEIPVPEWGEDSGVYIRALPLQELKEFGDIFQLPYEQRHAKLFTLFVCDENGQPLFSKEDAAELAKSQFALIDRIVAEAILFNKVGTEQKEAAKKN
jgi:hypothetical protein